MRDIRITIRGDGGYWHSTILSWLLEVKDLLEEEYYIKVHLEEDLSGDYLPEVYVERELAFKGVPREEGYLIELLKVALEKILQRSEM
ncbi:MAG: hypothetical protein DRJ59_02500 [Thermoprotei archaeon]|nr:MAG: hypothetical protein DRJ59_02500 [Thermoprotei archaeon]